MPRSKTPLGLLLLAALFASSPAWAQDSNTVIHQSDFRGINHSDQIVFYNDTFPAAHTDFTRDTFMHNADFSKSVFRGKAHFVFVQFNDYVDFTDAVFTSCAYFSALDINDNTYFDFSRTVLPDTLDFSCNSIIKREIDLTTAQYSDDTKKKCAIYLCKSDLTKFRLEYKYFTLLFKDPKNQKNILSDDEKENIYESLLKNFKDRGQMESYQLLDIEYQQFKWSRLHWFSWLGAIPRYWWNYGYHNEYIFYWVGILLLLFTIITFFCLEHLKSHVYEIKRIPETTYSRIKERLWYSFIYSSSIFFSINLNTDSMVFKSRIGTLYIMFVFSAGLICLGYIANFILQK